MQTDKRKKLKKKKKESEVKVEVKRCGVTLDAETITVSKGYPARMSGLSLKFSDPLRILIALTQYIISISFCNKGFLQETNGTFLTCLML